MATLAVYTRVSTDEQRTKGLSLNDQVLRGIDCAKKYSFDKYEVFQDAGLSGTLPVDKRPQLDALIKQITLGNIQAVFVTDIDRLSRDHVQTLILKSVFKENEIRLFDVNGEIQLNDVNQELLTDIRSLLAAFEVKKTSARIKRVLERNISEGKAAGGPLLNYGYSKDENKKLVIHPSEAKVVERIYTLALQGKGSKVIANILNDEGIATKRRFATSGGGMKVKGTKKAKESFKWRDAVIYRILTNPIYKGRRLYKGQYYDCPAIVPEGMYDAVQRVLKERKKFVNTTNVYTYVLKGLLVCKKCGQSMYGRTRADKSDHQYICLSQRYKNEFCGNRGINIDHANELVWSNLTSLDSDILKFYQWYEESKFVVVEQGFLINFLNDHKEVAQQITNLMRLGAGGNIPDETFQEEMKRLKDKKLELEQQIEQTKKSLKTLEEKEEVVQLIKKNLSPLKNKHLSDEEKAKYCQIFIEKIEVEFMDAPIYKHNVYITYKIDKLTQFKLAAQVEVNYKKSGFALRKKEVFQSHIRVERVLTPWDGDSFKIEQGQLHPMATAMINMKGGIPPRVFIDTGPSHPAPNKL